MPPLGLLLKGKYIKHKHHYVYLFRNAVVRSEGLELKRYVNSFSRL